MEKAALGPPSSYLAPAVRVGYDLTLTSEKSVEVLADRGYLIPPLPLIDCEEGIHHAVGQVQARGVDGSGSRQIANGAFERLASTLAPLDDPAQHPEVLPEAGPDEPTLGVLAEPIDVENFR